MNDEVRQPGRTAEEKVTGSTAMPVVPVAFEASHASLGAILAQCREQCGLSTAEAASSLKLSVRQIEAIERNDWSVFASPALLRGVVRAYARAVNADGDALLALLPKGTDPGATLSLEPTLSAPMPSHNLRGAARWWLRSGIVGVAVIGVAVLVGKLGWNPLDLRPIEPTQSDSAPEPVVVPRAPSQPLQLPGSTSIPERASLAGAQTVALPSDTAQNKEAPDAKTGSVPSSSPVLRINVQNESWIEITDAAGRVLLSAVQPAGAQQDLNGRAPFSVVVGNAPGVHIEYAGKPVDLAPYTRGNVARFALN